MLACDGGQYATLVKDPNTDPVCHGAGYPGRYV
jgi:hypothetical protein